jgi:nucleotidyltransferase/DNA polymerase involved in DNA repair
VILTDLTVRSRSATLEQPTKSLDTLKKMIRELLEKFLEESDMEARRVGVKVSQLSKEEKVQKRLESFFEK